MSNVGSDRTQNETIDFNYSCVGGCVGGFNSISGFHSILQLALKGEIPIS